MIHDAGALELKTVFGRAGLPSGMFTAFRLAVDISTRPRWMAARTTRTVSASAWLSAC